MQHLTKSAPNILQNKDITENTWKKFMGPKMCTYAQYAKEILK